MKEPKPFVGRRLEPRKPLRLEGLELHGLFFDNCSLGAVGPPGTYSTLARSTLAGTRQRACSLGALVVDEVLVDGLANLGGMPLFLSAVVFRHVTLRGPISSFKLHLAPFGADAPEQEKAWTRAHCAFYADVDWALDISQARFGFGPDLHFVPGHLVRRDEETQVLVSRQALADVDVGELPWQGSAIEIALEWFLEDGPYDSAVLVAGRKSKAFRKDLAALAMLRLEGLAR